MRFVFEDLLTLADSDGVVDMTPEAISRRTNVPIELVRRGLAALEAPDPRSRTPDHEGRRIVRLDDHRDWGWLIVNYGKFRLTASDEQRREKTRLRVERFRAKKASGNGQNGDITHGNACNAMEREKEKESKKESKKEKNKQKEEDTKSSSNGSSQRRETDADFMARLKKSPAYLEINVETEAEKMRQWCIQNGKQPTRKRFVNWLNRCDKPMRLSGKSADHEKGFNQ